MPETYLDLARKEATDAVGVRVGGKTYSLSEQVMEGKEFSFLFYRDEEGRRLYERSLLFVFMMACKNVLPMARVRVENSTGAGMYAYMPDREGLLFSSTIRKIEEEMRSIVAEDKAFVKRAVPREEAIRVLNRDGETDKSNLLRYNASEKLHLYGCGTECAYFYGPMLPSTGFVKVFALRSHIPGMEIIMPDKNDPTVPAKSKDEMQLMRSFAENARWADILGCSNVWELNEMTENGSMREFIRVNEALQEKRIMDIAEKINASGARLILIAGPSSSGKTTFSKRLSVALRVLGKVPSRISMDDYYMDRATYPLGENGLPDLERPECLNIDRFNEDMRALLEGETITPPTFDFVRGVSVPGTETLTLGKNGCVIVEGIHALNERFSALVPKEQKFRVYISALTTLNMDDHNRIHATDLRLLRRIVRDARTRGCSPENTIALWEDVRRGEEKYIFPYQETADATFNSTLVYEVAMLKRHAYKALSEISEDSDNYAPAHNLVKYLDYVLESDAEDEIPRNSILREFVGGSCFER